MTTCAAIEPETPAAVQAFAEAIRRDFSVKHILLHGSRARGDHQPDNDVDVAVVLEGARGRRAELAGQMARQLADILLETGLVLSAYPKWEDPKQAFNPWHIRSIKTEDIWI